MNQMKEQRKKNSYVQELEVTGETFRLFVNQVKDYAIFLLDVQGNVSTWNAGAEALKGYTADEIIGKHFSRFYD